MILCRGGTNMFYGTGPLASNFLPRSGEAMRPPLYMQSGPARLRVPGSQTVRCPPGGPRQPVTYDQDAVTCDQEQLTAWMQ